MLNISKTYQVASSLQCSLEARAKAKNIHDAEVAYFADGIVSHAALSCNMHHDGKKQGGYSARVGCLSKWLTSVLVANAVGEGRIQYDDSVSRYVKASLLEAHLFKRLEPIKVYHLLSHCHGLDDSQTQELRRRSEGMIDSQELLTDLLRFPSITFPGDKFNYGNGGVWIAAAVLEGLYGLSHPHLLHKMLFAPLGIVPTDPSGNSLPPNDSICPATGNDLCLSAADLLKVLRYQLEPQASSAGANSTLSDNLRELWNKSYVPAGRQWQLRRVALGLNDYGGGWYGHNAHLHGDSAVIRFNPERKIAIAITASQEVAAFTLLGSIFGHAMPEFSSQPAPRYLTSQQWLSIDSSGYVGRYENASLALIVDVAANKSLRVRVFRKSDLSRGNTEPSIKRYLRPAEDDLFFSSPPEPLVIPFVQFLERTEEGQHKYLCTGRQIYPRNSL